MMRKYRSHALVFVVGILLTLSIIGRPRNCVVDHAKEVDLTRPIFELPPHKTTTTWTSTTKTTATTPPLPKWHLTDDIDVDNWKIDNCAVQPPPQQIMYNRIGKAGSMSVSQAVIDASHQNSFAWKSIPTGEFGKPQQFLELIQQYVGLGLGCVSLNTSTSTALRGRVETSDLAIGLSLPPCDKVFFIGHVFYFDLHEFLGGTQNAAIFIRPA